MNSRIIGLAKNTFKEGVRDRLFLAVGVFGLVILGGSFIIGPLSLGEQGRITQDIGLATISILSFLIAILIGTGIVYREIEKRTIYTVVSKPVSRWQFIVGKFLGLNTIVVVLVVGMTMVLALVSWIGGTSFEPPILAAVLLIWMEVTLLTALSILMSTLCSPILGAIFTLLLYVIGHTSGDLKDMAVRFGSPAVRFIVGVIYHSLPNLEYLNIRSKVIHGVEVDISYIAFACSYALLYSVIFLIIAILVFERKEFK